MVYGGDVLLDPPARVTSHCRACRRPARQSKPTQRSLDSASEQTTEELQAGEIVFFVLLAIGLATVTVGTLWGLTVLSKILWSYGVIQHAFKVAVGLMVITAVWMAIEMGWRELQRAEEDKSREQWFKDLERMWRKQRRIEALRKAAVGLPWEHWVKLERALWRDDAW